MIMVCDHEDDDVGNYHASGVKHMHLFREDCLTVNSIGSINQ